MLTGSVLFSTLFNEMLFDLAYPRRKSNTMQTPIQCPCGQTASRLHCPVARDLAIPQLAALKITGKLAACQERFGNCVMPCIVYICVQYELLFAAGCAADIPDGISALRQLTSLEYTSLVSCVYLPSCHACAH